MTGRRVLSGHQPDDRRTRGRVHALVAVDVSGWEPLITTVQRMLPPDASATVASFVRPVPVAGLAAPPMEPIAAYQQVRTTTQEAMTAAAENAATDAATVLGPRADVRVAVAEPGPGICDLAAEIAADLVVVGSTGRGALARAVLGSVSDHVVHHAACAVLVVPLESP